MSYSPYGRTAEQQFSPVDFGAPFVAAGSPQGSRHEPTETDDPRNRLLDAFEGQVQALLDNGFEAQVRARLARLLPSLLVASDFPAGKPAACDGAPVASGRLDEGESEATRKTATDKIDTALGFANAIAVVTLRARAVKSGPSRDQAEAARRFLDRQLLALRGAQ